MTSLMLLLLMSSKVAVVSSGAFSAKQSEIAAKLSSSAGQRKRGAYSPSSTSSAEPSQLLQRLNDLGTMSDVNSRASQT